MRQLTVTACSAATFVEDLGRPGYGSMGVGVSGAADRTSHRLANRLVGNDESCATLEALLGGMAFTPDENVVIAVTGALCQIQVDGRAADHSAPVDVAAGQSVQIGPATTGLRVYVAVSGGIEVPPVLGSRSWDTMAKLGPPPLKAGDVLPCGQARGPLLRVDQAPVRLPSMEPLEMRLHAGPRDEWVHLDELFGREWVASSRSDRVGVRLEGEPLRRAAAFEDRELPSEGVVRGSVQVPTEGLPVLFLADHPVTGGYPVVAVIVAEDVDRLAQARPGQMIRFARVR